MKNKEEEKTNKQHQQQKKIPNVSFPFTHTEFTIKKFLNVPHFKIKHLYSKIKNLFSVIRFFSQFVCGCR